MLPCPLDTGPLPGTVGGLLVRAECPSAPPLAVRQPEGGFVTWCGLLFNRRTFEVQADYSRYHGDSIRDALTVEANGAVGHTLRRRLLSFLRPAAPLTPFCVFVPVRSYRLL